MSSIKENECMVIRLPASLQRKNVKELEEFNEEIEETYGIKSKQVYYLIDEIVKENFLTNYIFEKNGLN